MYAGFSGKKAVVVGGSSGIGRAIALNLLSSGASVSIIGRHAVEGIASRIIDLDLPENRELILANVQDADILCIVRGPFLQKSLIGTSPEEWASIVFANLTFPGMLVSASLPHMCANSWGRILLFGGTRTETIRGFRTNAAYGAAKTGLSSLVKSVSLEYGRSGVYCNAICPGFVADGTAGAEENRPRAVKNPDGFLVSEMEIADAARFLLENGAYNGVLLPVDKGWAPDPV